MDIVDQTTWWKVLDDNWDKILETMSYYLDLSATATTDCRKDSPPTGVSLLQDLMRAKEQRDHARLHTYLFATWDLAPDNRGIHSNPAWNELCALLSEDWVFEDAGPEKV